MDTASGNGGGYTVAAVLGVIAVLFLGKGAFHPHPADPRFAGLSALQHIPDGKAMPRATPVRVDIPDAGVHAPLLTVRRNPDGTVEVPPFTMARYAGWYGLGPAPGVRGASVIVGHYDDLHGAAAFYKLSEVRPFEEIEVTRQDHSVAVFDVDAVEKVQKTKFPADRVYGTVRYAGLRLVTCAGQFDRREHAYRENLIVYAHLVSSRPAAT